MIVRITLAALFVGCASWDSIAGDRPLVDPPRDTVEALQRNQLMSKDIQIQSRQQKAGGDAGSIRDLRKSYNEAERAQEYMRVAPGETYPLARERSEDRLQDLERKMNER